MAELSGAAACGAAIKADGYGLGARAVATRLAEAGCRDFFVATWAEAVALADLSLPVSVLHGLRAADATHARSGIARPVLNSAEQVARWRDMGGGPCDAMVDTGMNRLGLSPAEVAGGVLDGLAVDTLMSHLACAEEEHPLNEVQRARFVAAAERVRPKRRSLANSAGVLCGAAYAFDLTRPGLALYGGVPRPEAADRIRQVVWPEAEVLQVRQVSAGEGVGYGADFVAPADMRVAVLNIGYADGYGRGFSNAGTARAGDACLPVAGRVSMDLLALDARAAPDLREGDWIGIDFALAEAAALAGRSQYELLTGLGRRFDRQWHA